MKFGFRQTACVSSKPLMQASLAANLEEYLGRIRLLNEVFSIGWKVKGTCGTNRSRRIITSQPAYFGKPPTLAEIRGFMEDRGFIFHRTRFGDAWFRTEDGMFVSDAEPKNAVLTLNGIMPFDFLIARPAPKLLKQAGIIN